MSDHSPTDPTDPKYETTAHEEMFGDLRDPTEDDDAAYRAGRRLESSGFARKGYFDERTMIRTRRMLRENQIREYVKIERKNLVFNSASLAEKRMTIARDVLERLDAKKLIAQTGYYIKFRDEEGSMCRIETPEGELGRVFPEEIQTGKVTCHACALGSMMMATLDRFNGVTVSGNEESSYPLGKLDDILEDSLGAVLTEYFEIDQLHLIEACFEGWRFGTDGDTTRYRKTLSADDRLRRIMQNIVDNGGTFTPLPEDFSIEGERHPDLTF